MPEIQYGDIGYEMYILEVDYPYSWNNGFTLHYNTEADLEAAVEEMKKRSTPRCTEGYIKISVGIVTVVN